MLNNNKENRTIDFNEFLKQREEASNAFANGDINPLNVISAQNSPATIFDPSGYSVQGVIDVNIKNKKSVDLFKSGSTNKFEVLHKAADNNIAYWVGIQRSIVQMKGQNRSIPMDLRVTEIFRREDDQWKLFHRHADFLKTDDNT